MKLGFVSAILDGWMLDEVLDVASNEGFQCIEVACWPQGETERRYAGVSHIDVANLTKENAEGILKKFKEKGLEISALHFIPIYLMQI